LASPLWKKAVFGVCGELWCFVVDLGFVGVVIRLYWHLPGLATPFFVRKTWIDCGELCG
jgi:hypothetical protein